MSEPTSKKFNLFMYMASILVYGFCVYLLMFAQETDFLTYFGAIFFSLSGAYFAERVANTLLSQNQKGVAALLGLPFLLISMVMAYQDSHLPNRVEMIQVKYWAYVTSMVKSLGFIFGIRILLMVFFPNLSGEDRLK